MENLPEYHILYDQKTFLDEFCRILDAYHNTNCPPVVFSFFTLNKDGSVHHLEYRFHTPTFVLKLFVPGTIDEKKQKDIEEYIDAKAILCHQHLNSESWFDEVPV